MAPVAFERHAREWQCRGWVGPALQVFVAACAAAIRSAFDIHPE
jgi:hypothetical protein